jgi:hypothetical protein
MKTISLYNVLGIICFVVWIITTIFQVINPHPYRGLIGNLVLVIGLILFYIHAKINHIKSPLYDPDKKKHIRNWVVFILSSVLIVIMVGFLYWKIF